MLKKMVALMPNCMRKRSFGRHFLLTTHAREKISGLKGGEIQKKFGVVGNFIYELGEHVQKRRIFTHFSWYAHQ